MQLLARLDKHARENGESLAYRDAATGETLSYSALFRRAAGFAHRLHRTHPANAVVLICLENTCDYPVAFLGTLAAGMAAFCVSPDSPPAELNRLAERSSTAEVIGRNEVLDHEADDLPQIPPAEEQTRLMLLSSGSTGVPKIVCRSARAVDAVAEQMVLGVAFRPNDRVLAAVPLCHSYGIEHGLLAPVWAGSTVHLCHGFDLSVISAELGRSAITLLPGVPAMFEMLVRLGLQRDAMSSVRAAYSAGGPLPSSVAQAFADRFGVTVSQLYGATEVGSITYADPRLSGFNAASVGRPMKNVHISIDENGQVLVRADSMLSGYLGEPRRREEAFATGDLGHLDEHGNLVITGRTKLLIDVGGRKVNPMEVEGVLRRHERVADCVVVPMRQSETVVRLKAIVIPKDPALPPDVGELRDFARSQLPAYKVPRVFEIRESLPRSPAGKILRQAVTP
jgi:acyl-CoA synthetase (AMP-forming)/AMP-acid ligase II